MPAVAADHPTRRTCDSTGGAAATDTYTVGNGDAWFSIAAQAGVAASSLLAANDADASAALHPGDVLCLPDGADSSTQRSSDATSCASKRTVASGESWYVISRSTAVPMDALLAANDASTSSALHPGESLCVPAVGFGGGRGSTFLDVTPVRGTCRFANSWMAARGGRSHVRVDLIAPAGTPVVAAASGTLTKQTKGAAVSGNAWWLTTPSGTYFFYAHMSGFAKGLTVGSQVRSGDVIGFVGSTGNSVSPHLHFEIHPDGGGPVNPYESIWTAGGCTFDRRYEQAPLS